MLNSMNEMGMGYVVDEEKEKKICPYCGKVLNYMRLVMFNRISAIGFYEECDCAGAKREKEEREKIRLEEEKRQQELEQIERLFKNSRLGERFKQRTFENFDVSANPKAFEIALDYAENFDTYKRAGQGLMFVGPFGTGKTHLAAAIANYLLKNKVPVIFGTLGNLLADIKDTFDEDSLITTARVRNQLRNVQLLIIDDLGKEKVTPWMLEEFYNLLNARYEALKPVVITTNLSLEEIEQKYEVENYRVGGAITSRLIEMCRIVKMEGEDYRLIQRKRGTSNAL